MPLDCFTFCPNWSRMTLACGSFWAKTGKEKRAINNINKYLIFQYLNNFKLFFKVISATKIVNCCLMNNPTGIGPILRGYFIAVIGFVENRIARYLFYKAPPLACCLGLAQRYLLTLIDPLSDLPCYNLASCVVVLRK